MASSLPRGARAVIAAAALLAAALLLAAAAGGCGPRGERAAAPVVLADSLLARGAGGEMRLIRLRDARGTVHEGWLRLVPGDGAGGYQPVLILGGIGTGRRAAEIVPCPPGFAVLALDYPYAGPREPTRDQLLGHAREIRRAAHAAPRGVTAALRYLEARPDVSRRGTLVVGASFGVPFVLAGIGRLPRERDPSGSDRGPRGVRAVSLLFGGADLPNLARYRLRERPWWEREAAAWALQLFFAGLEPRRWVGRVSPRPLLLINGTRDEFVSAASARALERAARKPKQQIWLESVHLQPDAEALLRQLTGRTLQWLREVETSGTAARPGAQNPGTLPAPSVSNGTDVGTSASSVREWESGERHGSPPVAREVPELTPRVPLFSLPSGRVASPGPAVRSRASRRAFRR